MGIDEKDWVKSLSVPNVVPEIPDSSNTVLTISRG